MRNGRTRTRLPAPGAKFRSRNAPGKNSRAAENSADLPASGPGTFSRTLREIAASKSLSFQPEPAPLAALEYPAELELKNEALRLFWKTSGLPDKPSRILPSPLPRHYRSTSKRKPIWRRNRWDWDFFPERPGGEITGDPWILELPAHVAVYAKALEKLREAAYAPLAHNLNFLIVRGDADLMVLFNVHRLNADVVRKAKLLADHLRALTDARVVSAYLFCDPSRSPFYLEGAQRPLKLKRLFGPEFLPVTVAGRRYFLPPAGFFQVNPSLLPRLIDEVLRALKPRDTDRLLDLYCGCGLFTIPAGALCSEALGLELSPEACVAGRQSAAAAGLRQTRFEAAKIDPPRLTRLLPPAGNPPEIILLDPPRQGTPAGLISLLAARRPRRVAHLFCDLDTLPREVDRWRKHGYMVAKVQAFDLFPGTDNLEVLVVLLPDRYGLLGRKPASRFSPPAANGPE